MLAQVWSVSKWNLNDNFNFFIVISNHGDEKCGINTKVDNFEMLVTIWFIFITNIPYDLIQFFLGNLFLPIKIYLRIDVSNLFK